MAHKILVTSSESGLSILAVILFCFENKDSDLTSIFLLIPSIFLLLVTLTSALPQVCPGHHWPLVTWVWPNTCHTSQLTFVTVTWHVTWQLWHLVNCLQIGNFTLLLCSNPNCGPCPSWPQPRSHYPSGTWCWNYSREFEHRGTKNSWYSGSKSWLMQTDNKQGGHKKHCIHIPNA